MKSIPRVCIDATKLEVLSVVDFDAMFIVDATSALRHPLETFCQEPLSADLTPEAFDALLCRPSSTACGIGPGSESEAGERTNVGQ